MFSFRNRTPQLAPGHNITVPSSPQRSGPADVTHGLIDLSLRLIDRDADNGRGDDEHENISELTDSIRTQGVLQPILVRPTPHGRYRIVAGERRYRAAMLVPGSNQNAARSAPSSVR
ncbi:MAG: ParB/RepB/Spo0J family partition protein [Gammaproteobacteria bacterium]